MVVFNAALFSLLLPAAVLARPNQHERLHKRHENQLERRALGSENEVHPYEAAHHPIHPSGSSSTAPYPTGNSTQSGPTATGTVSYTTDRVTLTSIIEVVPVPVTKTSASQSENGQSSPSGSPGSPGHPGENGSEEVCGPATVTVTSPAKTVTVTVPAAGQKTPESKPAEHPAPKEHKPEEKPKEHPQETKPETKPEEKKAKPEVHPQESKPKEEKPKEEKPKAQPEHAKAPETESKVEKKPEHQPEEHAKAPEVQQKNTEKAKEKTPEKQPSTKSSPSGGNKARGILYKDITQANAMSGHVSWGCNWDSSPKPAVGHADGNLDFEFVPQLWGPDQLHTDLWAANSAGDEIKYVMAFNEPNQPRGAGGCGPISPAEAVAPYEKHLSQNKKHGQKIISPCVSNEAHEWIDTFVGSTSLKPDVLCFHWYGQNLKELQGVVSTFADIQSKHGIPELWLTEWALNVDIPTNDALKLLEWLENESGVQRFAYNNEKLATTPGVKQAYCGAH